MDEVTFTDEGVEQVARLLSAPPEGAYLYASDSDIGAAGVGLGWATEPGGDGRYIYSSGPAQGDNLSSDRPLTDAELDAVLEAGGFKPVEPAEVGARLDARGLAEASWAGYEEGYADGSADATQSALNQGYDKGFEEGRDAGVNDVRNMVAALTDIEEFDRVFEGAKAARLAYWGAIGEPRHSEPGPISLKGWVAALRAAAEV